MGRIELVRACPLPHHEEVTAPSTQAPHPGADPAGSTDPRTTIILRTLTVAAFVVILNETIMNNALPRLMAHFEVPATTAQWLSTSFMLTMAVVIPTSGWLLQRLGVRGTFVLAMSLFTAGTALAAAAPTFEVLIGARVVQACGTAVMIPLLMTTLMNLVPENDRGRVMGNVSLVIAVAPAMGPAVSGLLLQIGSWRLIFLAVLPIAAIALAIGMRLLPRIEESGRTRLDLLSLLLSAIGFGGLIYGLSSLGGGHGSADEPAPEPVVDPIVAVAVSVLALALFAWRQIRLQRGADPLLDLRAFTYGGYTAAFGTMCLSFLAFLATIILLPIHLQQVLGLSTLTTGLLLIPGGLAMGLLGPTVGRAYDRYGAPRLVLPGTVAMTLMLGLLALLAPVADAWLILVLHVCLSLALAMTFTPLFTAGLGSLPSHLYSHGSAILGSLQQVAGAAGTALSIAVMSLVAGSLVDGGEPGPDELAVGMRASFAVLAAVGLLAIACATRVRTPPPGTERSEAPAH